MRIALRASWLVRAVVLSAVFVLVGQARFVHAGRHGAFSFFAHLIALDQSDRERLDRGDVLVRVLPARDGELAVFAASRVNAPPDALISWTRRIEELKESRFAPVVRRFSDPPALHDLDDHQRRTGPAGKRACR